MVDRIKHERILLQRRARVWRGNTSDEVPSFEMFCVSRDLSISGIFLNSLCLMRNGTEVRVDLEVRDGEWLTLNGHVARRIELADSDHHPGFAVKFGVLSDRSHETLLRYFVTEKIEKYVAIFHQRFPHLVGVVSEQDIALIVNLWEDHRHLLVTDTQDAPVKPAPRTFGGSAKGILATAAQAEATKALAIAKSQQSMQKAQPAAAPARAAVPANAQLRAVPPIKVSSTSAKPAAVPTKEAPAPAAMPKPVAVDKPASAKASAPAAKAVPSKPTPASKPQVKPAPARSAKAGKSR